jgi:hypothetical protein
MGVLESSIPSPLQQYYVLGVLRWAWHGNYQDAASLDPFLRHTRMMPWYDVEGICLFIVKTHSYSCDLGVVLALSVLPGSP